MLADYKLNEGKLKNSQGALGSAILSSPPPTWNSVTLIASTKSHLIIFFRMAD